MLDHAAEEGQDRYGFMLNGGGLVVSIPVADRLAVKAFDASDADWWGGDVLGEVLGESFAAGRHLSRLQERDEAPGIVVPTVVQIGLERLGVSFLGQQSQQMVLPFAVQDFVGEGADRFPAALRVHAPGGEQDVQRGVVAAGAPVGLQDDDGPDGQRNPGTGVQDIAQAVVSDLPEAAEQRGASVEVAPEELRHGENFRAVGDVRQEPSADELGPVVGIDLGTGQAKARLAGEGASPFAEEGSPSCPDTLSLVSSFLRERVLDGLRMFRLTRVTLDFDGSVLSTQQRAEGTAVGFNRKKKGAHSYYPLFCRIAQTGPAFDFLFRPGNVHNSQGAEAFLLAWIEAVRAVLANALIEVRREESPRLISLWIGTFVWTRDQDARTQAKGGVPGHSCGGRSVADRVEGLRRSARGP